MLKQNEDCHIINTSSTAGLISSQFHEGIYDMTKHAVVALSEGLSNELSAKKSKIKVSVLCPGLVKTNLLESKRNSPLSISDREINFDVSVENFLEIHPEAKSDMKKWMGWWKRGISPEKVGEVVFKAIKDDVFYILTDNSDLLKGMIENRMKRILKALEQNEKYMK
ncbi:hypothetical protein LCGC14_1777180 [marine sediment metagenome]|uniref:Short-chain dehydrogenase/reductase SDR n=1 Tax=marine sediment metagenome TaxID=412755 RepID=A0A0F9HJ15_9ZZZZ